MTIDEFLEAHPDFADSSERSEVWEVEGEPGKWWPCNPILFGDPPRGSNFRKRVVTYGPYEYIKGEPWTTEETDELRAALRAKTVESVDN